HCEKSISPAIYTKEKPRYTEVHHRNSLLSQELHSRHFYF
ncbi:hypothetical protein EC900091_5265, partial [Escherichia coli 90.0091]